MIKISNLNPPDGGQISNFQKYLSQHKYVFLSLVCFVITVSYVTSSVLAQEPTPETSSAPVNQEKVQELKEKLATKVAELRESQKRGFYGTVEALSKTSFTLVTANSEVRVKLSEDTIIKDAASKDIQVTDLKNTQTVSVLGLYDEETLQAKVILVKTTPVVTSGTVESIDQKDATITVKNSAGDLIIYDYEKTTSADEYSLEDKKIAKSGLSRIDEGDRLIVWGTESDDEQNRYTAVKILRLPAILYTNSSDIKGETVESSASASPKTSASSSPSARPRTSPSPTPRTSPRTTPATN